MMIFNQGFSKKNGPLSLPIHKDDQFYPAATILEAPGAGCAG